MIEIFIMDIKQLYLKIITEQQISIELEDFRKQWGDEKLGGIYQKLCKRELKKILEAFIHLLK